MELMLKLLVLLLEKFYLATLTAKTQVNIYAEFKLNGSYNWGGHYQI